MTDTPRAANAAALRFKSFIEKHPPGIAAFAQRIGTTRQAVYNYAEGKQFPTLERAYLIEQATDGYVTMQQWGQAKLENKKSVKRKRKQKPNKLDDIL